MRGSLFTGSPWSRTPIAPLARTRLAQTCPINAAPGECTMPDSQPATPTTSDPNAASETPDHSVSAFPIVPVAASAAGLILLVALLKG